MNKTIEEAAREYAEDIRKGMSFHHFSPHEVAGEVEQAFLDGAERMREYIFQIYDNSFGNMDFVKWKLNRDEDE